MEMEKWSDYGKYLVLADNSNTELRDTYESFLNYKIVMEVVNRIAYTDKSTYSYNTNIYKKKVTSDDAKKIIHNVASCRWTDNTAKMKIIASQLGVFL